MPYYNLQNQETIFRYKDVEERYSSVFLSSDFCECRQVLQTAGYGGLQSNCSVGLDIQELCNGTVASPCDCSSSQECQVHPCSMHGYRVDTWTPS